MGRASIGLRRGEGEGCAAYVWRGIRLRPTNHQIPDGIPGPQVAPGQQLALGRQLAWQQLAYEHLQHTAQCDP